MRGGEFGEDVGGDAPEGLGAGAFDDGVGDGVFEDVAPVVGVPVPGCLIGGGAGFGAVVIDAGGGEQGSAGDAAE
jgi:hypothetical protein